MPRLLVEAPDLSLSECSDPMGEDEINDYENEQLTGEHVAAIKGRALGRPNDALAESLGVSSTRLSEILQEVKLRQGAPSVASGILLAIRNRLREEAPRWFSDGQIEAITLIRQDDTNQVMLDRVLGLVLAGRVSPNSNRRLIAILSSEGINIPDLKDRLDIIKQDLQTDILGVLCLHLATSLERHPAFWGSETNSQSQPENINLTSDQHGVLTTLLSEGIQSVDPASAETNPLLLEICKRLGTETIWAATIKAAQLGIIDVNELILGFDLDRLSGFTLEQFVDWERMLQAVSRDFYKLSPKEKSQYIQLLSLSSTLFENTQFNDTFKAPTFIAALVMYMGVRRARDSSERLAALIQREVATFSRRIFRKGGIQQQLEELNRNHEAVTPALAAMVTLSVMEGGMPAPPIRSTTQELIDLVFEAIECAERASGQSIAYEETL